jgi:CubicO group peptidase (beta-lactamase class C family)
MKNTFLFCLLLMGGICQAQSRITPQTITKANSAEALGFNSKSLSRIDSLENHFVKEGIVPNAVTIVIRKGRIVYSKAFGKSNIEKNTPAQTSDIFRIASQTKAITTVALLSLMEEGKFHLEEEVGKYLPEFANPMVLHSTNTNGKIIYTAKPAKNRLTIRHLLTHTSGIPYEHPLDSTYSFQKSLPSIATKEAITVAQMSVMLSQRPLLHEPGESYTYGLNLEVAARLIEVLSGKSFDVFLKERVLDPLGMTDTYFYLPQEKATRLVELYSKEKTTEPMILCKNDTYRTSAISGAKTYFAGGAGLMSTALDYAKFCQMILNKGRFNNKRILSPSTIALMLNNQIGNLTFWGRQDGFSLGFQVIGPDSHYGDNATPGTVTWGGMYCSEYSIDPEKELIVLIFTNIHPFANYTEFLRKYRSVVYGALED